MGEFGAVSGHRDLHDSEGSLTSMISGSRLPLGYETGRFHLLGLGVYVKLDFSMITHFCGLNLHGGTPPIAPEGAKVEPHAYRLMFVCYPPSSMLGNLNQVTPLASLPKGVPLNLGPEITSFVYVLRYDIVTLILTPPRDLVEQEIRTNNACWTLDGSVVMDRFSHFRYVSRLTYQLVSYILQQLPCEYECHLDANKFFEAISISVDAELNSVDTEPNSDDAGPNSVDAANFVNKRVNPGPWKYAPDSIAIDSDARSSFDIRRDHYTNWINHCQNRGQFIPYRYNYNYEVEKTKVTVEKMGASRPKGSKGKNH